MDEFNAEGGKEGEDLKIDLLTAVAKASAVEVVRPRSDRTSKVWETSSNCGVDRSNVVV